MFTELCIALYSFVWPLIIAGFLNLHTQVLRTCRSENYVRIKIHMYTVRATSAMHERNNIWKS